MIEKVVERALYNANETTRKIVFSTRSLDGAGTFYFAKNAFG